MRSLIHSSRTGGGHLRLHLGVLVVYLAGPRTYGDAGKFCWTRALRGEVFRNSGEYAPPGEPRTPWWVIELYVLGWGFRWCSREPWSLNLFAWWPCRKLSRAQRRRVRAVLDEHRAQVAFDGGP